LSLVFAECFRVSELVGVYGNENSLERI
jgi:hypothetical protein